MQVVHLRWNRASAEAAGLGELLGICESVEVIAHLDVSSEGIRQLLRCTFLEGKSVDDFEATEYMTFEGKVHSRGDAPPPIVALNTHPLAIAAVRATDIAVLPPYGIGPDGFSITLRGLPRGISEFLASARAILPPDEVIVTFEGNEVEGMKDLLAPRQFEVVQAAVQWGYYDDPRGISMRKLAERLDMARSTVGEHLHSAESTLMQWFIENAD